MNQSNEPSQSNRSAGNDQIDGKIGKSSPGIAEPGIASKLAGEIQEFYGTGPRRQRALRLSVTAAIAAIGIYNVMPEGTAGTPIAHTPIDSGIQTLDVGPGTTPSAAFDAQVETEAAADDRIQRELDRIRAELEGLAAQPVTPAVTPGAIAPALAETDVDSNAGDLPTTSVASDALAAATDEVTEPVVPATAPVDVANPYAKPTPVAEAVDVEEPVTDAFGVTDVPAEPVVDAMSIDEAIEGELESADEDKPLTDEESAAALLTELLNERDAVAAEVEAGTEKDVALVPDTAMPEQVTPEFLEELATPVAPTTTPSEVVVEDEAAADLESLPAPVEAAPVAAEPVAEPEVVESPVEAVEAIEEPVVAEEPEVAEVIETEAVEEVAEETEVAPEEPAGPQIILANEIENGAIRVMVNDSKVINTSVPFFRVSVAQPDVVDIKPIGPKQLLLTAKSAGTTQIVLWDENDDAQTLLLQSGADLREVSEKLATLLPGEDIEAIDLRGSIALRGRVSSIDVANQALEVASTFGTVVNLLEIGGNQQVQLSIKFAEVSRAAGKELGFEAGFTDGPTIIGSNIGNVAGFSFEDSDGGDGVILGVPIGLQPAAQFFGRGTLDGNPFGYFVNALRENNQIG
ncbi:MAG: pilus assembly protein N-terminal domain-containing protein, partial [Planctomycetota bacterium]